MNKYLETLFGVMMGMIMSTFVLTFLIVLLCIMKWMGMSDYWTFTITISVWICIGVLIVSNATRILNYIGREL